jgi:hypothetical protein
MTWDEPIVNGFQGLNSFFGYITPYALPILFMIALGFLVLLVVRRVAGATS